MTNLMHKPDAACGGSIRLRQAPGRAGMAIALSGLLLFLLTGCSDSAGGEATYQSAQPSWCHAGRKATLKKQALPPGASPAIVLACGRSPFYGRTEIIGYKTREGICVSTALPERKEIHGGVCKPSSVPWQVLCHGDKACVAGSNNAHDVVEFFGIFSDKIERVSATVGAGDNRDSRPAITANNVEGDLLKRLGQSESFGVFAISVRGCKSGKKLKIFAIDKDGNRMRVGTSTGGFFPICS